MVSSSFSAMKLNSALMLLSRRLSTTVVQLTKPGATCCATRTVTTASLNAADDYDKSKPFSSIPGPTGLPYFGTLFYYRAGKLLWSVSRVIAVLGIRKIIRQASTSIY